VARERQERWDSHFPKQSPPAEPVKDAPLLNVTGAGSTDNADNVNLAPPEKTIHERKEYLPEKAPGGDHNDLDNPWWALYWNYTTDTLSIADGMVEKPGFSSGDEHPLSNSAWGHLAVDGWTGALGAGNYSFYVKADCSPVQRTIHTVSLHADVDPDPDTSDEVVDAGGNLHNHGGGGYAAYPHHHTYETHTHTYGSMVSYSFNFTGFEIVKVSSFTQPTDTDDIKFQYLGHVTVADGKLTVLGWRLNHVLNWTFYTYSRYAAP
tara:strand:+ start:11058 stop:11849 length:792 start_codon:yes stop_codon:yes gene_type:complete